MGVFLCLLCSVKTLEKFHKCIWRPPFYPWMSLLLYKRRDLMSTIVDLLQPNLALSSCGWLPFVPTITKLKKEKLLVGFTLHILLTNWK
jgi:hypothetical protein